MSLEKSRRQLSENVSFSFGIVRGAEYPSFENRSRGVSYLVSHTVSGWPTSEKKSALSWRKDRSHAGLIAQLRDVCQARFPRELLTLEVTVPTFATSSAAKPQQQGGRFAWIGFDRLPAVELICSFWLGLNAAHSFRPPLITVPLMMLRLLCVAFSGESSPASRGVSRTFTLDTLVVSKPSIVYFEPQYFGAPYCSLSPPPFFLFNRGRPGNLPVLSSLESHGSESWACGLDSGYTWVRLGLGLLQSTPLFSSTACTRLHPSQRARLPPRFLFGGGPQERH